MTKKLFAIMLLSLTLAACEPASTENSNANTAATPQPASTPAPVSPSPETNASPKPAIKAGDKVKVTMNGVTSDAIVVATDEKGGKVTVRISGQKEEKTVAVADVTK